MPRSQACAWFSVFLCILTSEPPAQEAPDPSHPCEALLEDVRRLYAARDTALLAFDITAASECPDTTLYQAAYYQGFAFYMVGDHRSAASDLELARSLRGPWDEQVLYYLWKLHGFLGDKRARAAAHAELKRRFPLSPRLAEMAPVRRRAKRSFEGSASTGAAWLLGERSYQGLKSRSALGAAWNQERGAHAFQEFLSASGKFSLDGRGQHFYGMEAGARWRHKGFRALLSAGPLRSEYKADSLSEWELQAGATLSQTIARPGDREWTASLSYYQEGWSIDRASFASVSAGWEADRVDERSSRTWNFQAEYQQLDSASGCPDLERDCRSARYAAFQAGWSSHRFAGRGIFGLEADLNADFGERRYRRLLATAGPEAGLRLGRGARLTAGVDLGWDFEDQDGLPYRSEPVFNVSASVSARF